MLIKAKNNLTDQAHFSYLSQGEASGAATLRVKNINGFTASYAQQIGKTGEELAEIVVLGTAAPSGTALSITGTTRYAHAADTPIYQIKYDQVVFERSTAGTAGTATVMTDGTVSITPDSLYTVFDDTTGASSYAYKIYFRNSITAATSAESDWLTPGGPSFYSLAKLRDRIKNKLRSANYVKYDSIVDDWINEWLERMNNIAIDVNKDYQIGTVDVAFSGTAELGTITASDFKEVRRVWMTTNGTDFYMASKISLIDYTPQTTFYETQPNYYMQGDNVIGRKPADSSGTARISYYKMNAVLDSDADELPVSMRAYTKSFVDYGLSQAYYLDGKLNEGDRYLQSANQEAEKFRSEITPRSKSGPQYISITDDISADDSFDLL